MRISRDFQKQNKGMTLIELLVTIAIMIVVTTVSVIGIGLLMSGDSKKASKSILDKVNEVRTNTLSVAADWKVTLSNEDGVYYVNTYEGEVVSEKIKLGTRMEVTYTTGNGNKAIESGKELVISFTKSSGTVADVGYRLIGSADITSIKLNEDNKLLISIDSSSKGVYVLELWYATGKITEQE